MSRVALVSLVFLASTGCATLFAGGPERVTFTSNPQGAEVLLDGVPLGQTPLTIEIERKSFGQRFVTLRAQGYQARQFPLAKSLNVVAVFNLSSLCFWATDATTGALIEYEPSSYYFELSPAGAAPPRGPGNYYNYTPREQRALYFTLVNHRMLRAQIARRGGEHLDALATLLQVGDRDRARFIDALASRADRLIAEPWPDQLFRDIRAIAARSRG